MRVSRVLAHFAPFVDIILATLDGTDARTGKEVAEGAAEDGFGVEEEGFGEEGEEGFATGVEEGVRKDVAGTTIVELVACDLNEAGRSVTTGTERVFGLLSPPAFEIGSATELS